jgi:hypothetical protein
MAVWRRPGFLRQSNPGVPSDVMVCLRVLTRTGRMDCRHPCASFPPSSGSTAMSILCVARWRSALGMIERMCTQECWNPEVAIIFGAAARYCRATVGSSRDGAKHLYFSVGPSRQSEALVWLPRRAGSSGISWRIHSLVKKTLHRHRAGFEPQRASSFMRRVKSSQILGEAARA